MSAVVHAQRPYPFAEDGAQNALNALGLDPADVADELEQLGLRGVPGSDCQCPIANYLVAMVDRCTSAGVYLDDALGQEDEAHARLSAPGEEDLEIALPAAVIVFIRRFDAGRRYSELIEKTEEVTSA